MKLRNAHKNKTETDLNGQTSALDAHSQKMERLQPVDSPLNHFAGEKEPFILCNAQFNSFFHSFAHLSSLPFQLQPGFLFNCSPHSKCLITLYRNDHENDEIFIQISCALPVLNARLANKWCGRWHKNGCKSEKRAFVADCY